MKKGIKVRVRRARRVHRKLCDPGLCDHCTYIGEGDFLCDCHPSAEYVLVMTDWEPTVLFMHCLNGGHEHE